MLVSARHFRQSAGTGRNPPIERQRPPTKSPRSYVIANAGVARPTAIAASVSSITMRLGVNLTMGPSVPPLPAGARGVADARRPFVRIPRPAVPFREPAHTSRQTRSGVRGDCLARRARARPFVRIPRPAVPLREPARGIEREESAPSHRDASGDAGVMAAAMMLMRCRRASNVRCGSILLQKSFCTGGQKVCGP